MITISPLASSSRGNCYHITDGVTPLLLDAGISIKRIRQGVGFGLSSVIGCLVTHLHGDHLKAVPDLLKAGIDCYMSEGTAQGVDPHHRLHIIEPLKQFKLGEWIVLPFPAEHDCEGAMGFLLANRAGEKLLYLTDSYYCKYKFSGLTHLLLECNHSYEILDENVASGALPLEMKKRLIQSHMSLENAKKFLQANDLSKVKEIHLIHLSERNSDAKRFKREVQEVSGKPVFVAGE